MLEAAQKIIAKHQANDRKPGDDPNKERELQTIETLTSNADKILKFLSENEPRMGQGEKPKEVQAQTHKLRLFKNGCHCHCCCCCS